MAKPVPYTEIQEDVIGMVIRRTLTDPGNSDAAVDLTGATITFRFKPPDGSATIVRTGTYYGAATDGVAQYTTVSGDLATPDECTPWTMQVRVQGSGTDFYSEREYFLVVPNV